MTRYEQGFMNKCAEYGVDGRMLLKEAVPGGINGSVARLLTKLSPKVNPDKLNAFTRLFTTTKSMPTKLMRSPEMTKVISKLDDAGRLAYGAVPAAENGSIAQGMRNVTRLSPGRIAAALGGLGTAGYAASQMGGEADGAGLVPPPIGANPGSSGKISTKTLAALGLTAAAITAIAIAARRRRKQKNKMTLQIG